MKRAAVALVVVAFVFGAAAVAAAPPRASLRDLVCHSSPARLTRAVSVTGVMRPLSGTKTMALRFVLLRSSARYGPETIVRGQGLGSWITPKQPKLGQLPGDVWELKYRVVNLTAQAFYRFRVDFRWSGSGGRVLGVAVRRSWDCYEPG